LTFTSDAIVGSATKMVELQQDIRAEYEALTIEEWQELVNKYVSQKCNSMKIWVNACS
jgi:hypothetical protein